MLDQSHLEELGDPAALAHREAMRTATAHEAASNDGECQLSASALARVNAALRDSGVRVFSGTKVRGRFDAREQASARVYECLLPPQHCG